MYIHTHNLQTCKLCHTHIYTHKHTHTHIVRTCVHTHYVYKHTLYVYMILENLLRGRFSYASVCAFSAQHVSASTACVCASYFNTHRHVTHRLHVLMTTLHAT